MTVCISILTFESAPRISPQGDGNTIGPIELRKLNDKLRNEILQNLNRQAQEKVIAEIEARERFVSDLEQGVEVKCSCGLVMSRSNFYEHRKDTKHEASVEGEKMETCSCGLTMSTTNLRGHQTETHHTTRPQQAKPQRPRGRPDRTRPTGMRPPPDFSFDKPYHPDGL